MSDLNLGLTRSYGFKFQSAGAAHTFTLPFQCDRVIFENYTKWGTNSDLHRSVWWRGMPAGDALQNNVITDNGATAELTAYLETTNGFTVADTSGGAPEYMSLIGGVSQADPCVVTTTAAHGLTTGQIVRVSDLGNEMPTARGMAQINNKRFKIVVTAANTFSLQDVITGEDIDSTGYTAWVAGGRVNLESRNALPFVYDPITYKLTAGTSVMGANDDIFFVSCFAFGEYEDLGDIA